MDLLNSDYGDGLVPQFVQLVVIPLGGSKYVNDNRAKISKHPA